MVFFRGGKRFALLSILLLLLSADHTRTQGEPMRYDEFLNTVFFLREKERLLGWGENTGKNLICFLRYRLRERNKSKASTERRGLWCSLQHGPVLTHLAHHLHPSAGQMEHKTATQFSVKTSHNRLHWEQLRNKRWAERFKWLRLVLSQHTIIWTEKSADVFQCAIVIDKVIVMLVLLRIPKD